MTSAHVRSLFWFAAGITVALIATMTFAAWRAEAIGGNESTFVPITPCRLVDTRPEPQFNIGPKSSPVGPDEEYVLQVTGNEGECSIPSSATAVSINLVGIAPTADTFLALFPANATNPGTAVLNLVAAQAPTPNKLDVKLSDNGRLRVYNKFGSVHIVGDVLGYYRNDNLANLEARLTQLETTKPFAVSASPQGIVSIDARTVVSQVEVNAPVAGSAVVIASATAVEDSGGDDVRCAISTSPTPFASNFDDAIFEAADVEGDAGGLARNRTFDMTAGQTLTFYFACASTGTASQVWGAQMEAIFLPAG